MIKKIFSSFVILSSLISPFAFLARPAEAALQFQGITSALLSCTGGDKTISNALNFGQKDQAQEAVSTDSQKINEANKETKERETCLKKISRIIIKQLMDKLTNDTIAWINGGFKGEPLFVKNPETFYTSIIDTEVANFANLTAFSGGQYPFGKDFAIGMINQYKGQFALAAQSSLANYVSTGRPADFYTNFNTGGWDAWMGLVSNPANNPIGYTMMASDEVARRTQDSNNNFFQQTGSNPNINEVRQEIASAGGFLAQKKCAASLNSDEDYIETSQEEEIEWRKIAVLAVPNDLNKTQADIDLAKRHVCGRYETLTPGQTISGQLDTALGSPFKSLDLNADFSDSMSAIFDALFNQLANKGLTALADAIGGDAGTQYSGVGNNSGELLDIVADPDEWNTFNQQGLSMYDFLIGGYDHDEDGSTCSEPLVPNTTPCTTLISIQKEWIKVMVGSNWQTNTTDIMDGGANDELFWLIRNTKRLDYWIPGPRPDWEDAAFEQLQIDLQNVSSYGTSGFSSFVQSLPGVSDTGAVAFQEGKKSLAAALQLIALKYKESSDQWYAVFPQEFDMVKNIYFNEVEKLPQYEKTSSENLESINGTLSAIQQLNFLKNKIQPLYVTLFSLKEQLLADPSNISLSSQIASTQKSIDKYQSIFDQLAPDIKSQKDIEDTEILKEFYKNLSEVYEDYIIDVKKQTYSWPNITRRPYASDGIWPSDPESKCWDTAHKGTITSNPGPTSYQPQLAGYTPQSFVAEINAYDIAHNTPISERLPSNAATSLDSSIASGAEPHIYEGGNQACTFLPYGEYGGGAIDLPGGSGDNIQDGWGPLGFPASMIIYAPNGGGIFTLPGVHEGFSVYEDKVHIY